MTDPTGLPDLAPATPVLVGLSGGLDSVVLLHRLAQSQGAREHGLRALHVHHGLHREAERVQPLAGLDGADDHEEPGPQPEGADRSIDLGVGFGRPDLDAVWSEVNALTLEADVDELVSREPRSRDDHRRLSMRDLEAAPVEHDPAPGEGLWLAEEGDVVHGDDQRRVAHRGNREARRVEHVDGQRDLRPAEPMPELIAERTPRPTEVEGLADHALDARCRGPAPEPDDVDARVRQIPAQLDDIATDAAGHRLEQLTDVQADLHPRLR